MSTDRSYVSFWWFRLVFIPIANLAALCGLQTLYLLNIISIIIVSILADVSIQPYKLQC